MRQSLICLRAARLPPLECTTGGGYLQGATSTSPLATASSPGTLLPTLGITCQIWCRLDLLAGATAGMTEPGSFYAVAGTLAVGTPTNDNEQYTETPCATPTPTPTATSTPTSTP